MTTQLYLHPLACSRHRIQPQMSSKQISPLLQTWYKWKALRLPWRKRFLVGLDLQGNTYWEFRDVRGDDRAGKWRRIVQYPRNTHYGEVKVPPQWHQWLRHIRESPPSLQEQHLEVRRQAQMKYLAAEADARWEAKPRLTDAPAAAGTAGQPVAALEERSAGREAEDDEGGEGREKGRDAIATGKEQEKAAQGNRRDMEKPDPWKQKRRAGPSEDWQPQAWTPPASKR